MYLYFECKRLELIIIAVSYVGSRIKQVTLIVATSDWCSFPCWMSAEYQIGSKFLKLCIVTVDKITDFLPTIESTQCILFGSPCVENIILVFSVAVSWNEILRCLFVCLFVVVVLVMFAVDSVLPRIVIQLFAICVSVTCVFWSGVQDFSMCDSSWRDPARLTGRYDWHASLSSYHPLIHSGANKDFYLVLNNAQPTERVTLA